MTPNQNFSDSAVLPTPTHKFSGDGLDRASTSASQISEKATQVINGLASDAGNLAQRGIKMAVARSAQLREQAQKASENVTTYIKAEPVKAVLIAAATGAVLATLLSWRVRSPRVV